MALPYTTKHYVLPVDNIATEGNLVPVSNGTFFTNVSKDNHFQSGMFVIAFYDSLGNSVTPSAGTVKVESSPIEGQWRILDTINASEAGENASYTYPVLTGPMCRGKITLDGVSGATHFRAFFWRV